MDQSPIPIKLKTIAYNDLFESAMELNDESLLNN
jgi:hypothetical protein